MTRSFTNYDQLEEHGVLPLTGEACGLSMRVLCDLTEEGVDLIREFLRVEPTADPWNSKGVASIMMPRDMFDSLWIFAEVRAGRIAVFEGGYVAPSDWVVDHWADGEEFRHPNKNWKATIFSFDDRDAYENLMGAVERGSFYVQRWYKRSDHPGTGLDNQHGMSGRIV